MENKGVYSDANSHSGTQETSNCSKITFFFYCRFASKQTTTVFQYKTHKSNKHLQIFRYLLILSLQSSHICLRETDHLEDQGVDGEIIKWIFKKWDGGMDWIDPLLGIGTGGGRS